MAENHRTKRPSNVNYVESFLQRFAKVLVYISKIATYCPISTVTMGNCLWWLLLGQWTVLYTVTAQKFEYKCEM